MIGEVNWDHVAKIFEYGVQSCMNVDASEMPVMVVENNCGLSSNMKEESKEEMAELFFEKHVSPGRCAAQSDMLSVYSA